MRPSEGRVAYNHSGSDAVGQEVKVQNAGLGCLLEEEQGGRDEEAGVGKRASHFPLRPPSQARAETAKGAAQKKFHTSKNKPEAGGKKSHQNPFTNSPPATRGENCWREEVHTMEQNKGSGAQTAARGPAPRLSPPPGPPAPRSAPHLPPPQPSTTRLWGPARVGVPVELIGRGRIRRW